MEIEYIAALLSLLFIPAIIIALWWMGNQKLSAPVLKRIVYNPIEDVYEALGEAKTQEIVLRAKLDLAKQIQPIIVANMT